MTNKNEARWFFYDHAAYSWDPATESEERGRMRVAGELAYAETWARDNFYSFVWAPDVHDDGFDVPETCEWCAMVCEDGVVASIGCVDDADDNFRRVIEAELALEVKLALTKEG